LTRSTVAKKKIRLRVDQPGNSDKERGPYLRVGEWAGVPVAQAGEIVLIATKLLGLGLRFVLKNKIKY
jgi:hypothetical protein